jgi:hypothetical protein
MPSDNEHINISSRNASKNISEIALTHKHIVDLFGEVKTIFVRNKNTSVHAVIYEKGTITFREMIDIERTDYKISGVPYKIAVTDVQNALVAKLKAIMYEIALKREVVPEEQDSFAKMLENTCKAFPNLSRAQGMHLVLNALQAKRRRQLSADDESE